MQEASDSGCAGELRLGALIADLVMNSHILEEEARSGVFDVQ